MLSYYYTWMILNGNVLAEATWSNMKQHVILKTPKKVGEPLGEPRCWVLERKDSDHRTLRGTLAIATPSHTLQAWRARDASGPRDFHQRLPLPNILGILWEYPGNPFLNVQQHFLYFFRPLKEAGCPTNPRNGYSCQAFSERKDARFFQIVKVYHLFGFGRDWAVSVWFNQIAFKVRSQSTCTWFNQYQFHCNHARFLKKGGHFAHWLPGRIAHSTMMYNARLNVFIVLPVFRYSRFQVSLQMVIGWTDTAINTPAVQYICKGDATTRHPSAGCFCEQKSIWLLGL